VKPSAKPAAEPRGPLSDSWCFTENNPAEKIDPSRWPDLQYLVYQLEVGDNGTPHFQGYIQFKKRIRATALVKLLPRARTVPAQGDDKTNESYCTKPNAEHPDAPVPVDGPWRFGERVARAGKKGGRTDLLEIQRLTDTGVPMREIAKNHYGTYLRYNRGMLGYRDLQILPRTRFTHGDMRVVWIFGASSTGKTSRAIAECKGRPYWMAPQPKSDGIRYNGYDYQECCIFDDYTGKCMSWTHLMRLLDPYPYRVPTDGGSVEFVSKTIIFTSILHPELVYKSHLLKLNRDWTELNRRISEVIFLTETHEEGFRAGFRHPDADSYVLPQVTEMLDM